MSLYTKYRPKDWNSVIGQDYITTILKNSLISGRISHAYLFHGSRGTGKTTSARILAKGVNCLDLRDGNPCHECIHCQAFDNGTMLDVIEIDAASNTGVENIRDLIEKSRFEPNQGKYKIYIIDEVHMLSTGAFNALLKTLEEPPEHVKFILATTETEKVPETIRSRTLRFDFRKIGMEDILGRLEFVCKSENIIAETEALQIIAKSARGWLRDALTLLEQNVIDSEIRTEHVRYTLALIEETLIDTIIDHLLSGNTAEILRIIERLREQHVQSRSFFEQLLYRLRDLMIIHLSSDQFFAYENIFSQIEEAYTKVRSIPDGMMLVEITLLVISKWWKKEIHTEKIQNPLPASKIEIKKEETKNVLKEKIITQEKEETPLRESSSPVKNHSSSRDIESEKNTEKWSTSSEKPVVNSEKNSTFSFPLLLNTLKTTTTGLSTDLKMTRFKTENESLILTFSKKWNFDRVNTPKIKSTIADTLCSLFGWSWSVICHLEEGGGNLVHIADDIF